MLSQTSTAYSTLARVTIGGQHKSLCCSLHPQQEGNTFLHAGPCSLQQLPPIPSRGSRRPPDCLGRGWLSLGTQRMTVSVPAPSSLKSKTGSSAALWESPAPVLSEHHSHIVCHCILWTTISKKCVGARVCVRCSIQDYRRSLGVRHGEPHSGRVDVQGGTCTDQLTGNNDLVYIRVFNRLTGEMYEDPRFSLPTAVFVLWLLTQLLINFLYFSFLLCPY